MKGAGVPFSSSLTPEQRLALGLSKLTPEEVAALDAAVAGYQKTSETVVAQKAAETAVAEYKKKEEPSVVSRALELFKVKQAEERQERITATMKDKFTGWSGSTVFHLDNGQTWRQASSDTYHTKARENVPVVIYKAPSGYWRLRILDDEGAWVTVKRVE